MAGKARTVAAIFAAAACVVAAPARAEVVDQSADGFSLRFQTLLDSPAEDIWAALGQIGQWWESSHSYSGDATNMTIDLKPGGCFCEALPGGGVQHGVVVMAWPEQMLRLNAPLGPLQATGPAAVLTFSWAPGEGGRGLMLSATYVVSGPGVGVFAAPVEGVLKTQYDNLIRHIDTGE